MPAKEKRVCAKKKAKSIGPRWNRWHSRTEDPKSHACRAQVQIIVALVGSHISTPGTPRSASPDHTCTHGCTLFPRVRTAVHGTLRRARWHLGVSHRALRGTVASPLADKQSAAWRAYGVPSLQDRAPGPRERTTDIAACARAAMGAAWHLVLLSCSVSLYTCVRACMLPSPSSDHRSRDPRPRRPNYPLTHRFACSHAGPNQSTQTPAGPRAGAPTHPFFQLSRVVVDERPANSARCARLLALIRTRQAVWDERFTPPPCPPVARTS